MLYRVLGALGVVTTVLACVEPPVPPARDSPPSVLIQPQREGAVAPIARFSLLYSSPVVSKLGDLQLFEGELTDAQIERVERGDPAPSVAERRVGLIVWQGAESEVLAAPAHRLVTGSRYTLVARGFGRAAMLDVTPELWKPVMRRVWPPAGERSAGEVVLCGADLPELHGELVLDPGAVPASAVPTFQSDAGPCAQIRVAGPVTTERTLLLPVEVAGVLIDSEPFVAGPAEALTLLECEPFERPLGPACATVEDDRLQIETPHAWLLWQMNVNGFEQLRVSFPGEVLTIRGLAPNSVVSVRGTASGLAGHAYPLELTQTTRDARPRVVVNEILANPAGAEPASEWVELYNDGSAPADLAQYRLVDPGGVVSLPSALLAAGHYALLVRDDFSGGGPDVPPDRSVQLVRVPQLAKNGLANGGEALALVDAEGDAVSEFPALPSRVAGVSLARVTPDAPDGSSSSFAEHESPGASPGAPNTTRAVSGP